MVKYKKKGRKSKAPSKQVFDFQYYEMNMSPQEMAEYYGVKLQTIYNWATEYRKQDKAEE